MEKTTFADLPEDILLSIFPYLQPQDFLALCSVNRDFHSTYHFEPAYWREETKQTFRLPISPLLRADGHRWHWLYKKLRTKTRLYTWGQSQTFSQFGTGGHGRHALRARAVPRRPATIHWPAQDFKQGGYGVVVDVQCGGWSHTLLNSDGILHSVGKLDGLEYTTGTSDYPEPLGFPAGFPPTTATRYEPTTAIKQYSSGRRHVLGLSDSGKIWFWTDKKPALQMKFLHQDIVEGNTSTDGKGIVRKVVAGWEQSSAYIFGVGIVFWNVFKNAVDDDPEVDTWLHDVSRTTIPETDFLRPSASTNKSLHEDHPIGEVLNHIVLHEFIVFITDLNRVFAVSMKAMEEAVETIHDEDTGVFELTTFHEEGRVLQDIQGSFESFAVFSANGEVLNGDHRLLWAFWHNMSTPRGDPFPSPKLIPALQHTNVISLSFGDHHYHALHADGRISSYGTEPQGCGALGLGSMDLNYLRGVRRKNLDGSLVPHSEFTPHYIWFEEDKNAWLVRLHAASKDPSAQARVESIKNNIQLQGEFSEWVEQEGSAWADFPDIKSADTEGLGAYFAFNVAAAGWHSAALVLVHEHLAEQTRRKHIIAGDKMPLTTNVILQATIDQPLPVQTGEGGERSFPVFRYDFFDKPFPNPVLPSEVDGERGSNGWPGGRTEWRYGMPPVRWRADVEDV